MSAPRSRSDSDPDLEARAPDSPGDERPEESGAPHEAQPAGAEDSDRAEGDRGEGGADEGDAAPAAVAAAAGDRGDLVDEDDALPAGLGVSPEGASPITAIAVAAVVSAASAAALGVALSPQLAGSPWILGILGIAYGVAALAAIARFRVRSELRQKMLPQRGDISIGALLAVVLYLIATLGWRGLGGQGVPEAAWITRIYLQLGDPRFTSTFAVGLAVLGIAAAEEVAWRGLVQDTLTGAFGDLYGWLAATALWSLAHVPAVFLLADPVAGPNPLLPVAALGCGLVWGFLTMKTGRLGPGVFSHALFTWAVVEYPIWRM